MRIGTIIAVAATVAVVGGIFAYMEYSRTPAGADSKKVMHAVTAEELYADFQQDETAANAKYVGTVEQVIEVSGTIKEIDTTDEGLTTVILGTSDPMGGVACEFNQSDMPEDWRSGESVTVRGFCKGMLMDVLLQRCVPVQ